MYAKFGCSAMIACYAKNGFGFEALELFKEMMMLRTRSVQIHPNSVTMVSVLQACASLAAMEQGKVIHGYILRNRLSRFGMVPAVEHYAAMVDLLGRANRLEEAIKLVEDMRIEPGPKVWGSVLGSSRIHCNVELAERASKRLFELEPTNAGNYVVLADTYAGAGMWDEIEVKREMYSFVSVDRFDHARSEQLHALVFELAVQMKEKGYVPRTNVVLYDLEPEEKERIVLGHSEKLALAFGLVNTSHGEVIRITKNLRLCEDCHEFTKFISKFAGKEILVRDVNRLHRFRDGVCSCGDFW
ncbi:Pentatricopeptide repeat-containing protein At3g46790, chloroplastic [Linum grandiflorum]